MIDIAQYRVRIGRFSKNHHPHTHKRSNNRNIILLEMLLEVSAGNVFCWFYSCLIYMYIVCLLMGMFMKTSFNLNNMCLHTVLGTTPIIYNTNSLGQLLNLCLLLLLYTTKNS